MVAAGLVSLWVWADSRQRDPMALYKAVSVGASLEELRLAHRRTAVTPEDVHRWTERALTDRRSGEWFIETEHGFFTREHLGTFGRDVPPSSDDGFTGTICFEHGKFFSDTLIVEFTFFKGRMVAKDWGYLPG
jgi:hypothetical protein